MEKKVPMKALWEQDGGHRHVLYRMSSFLGERISRYGKGCGEDRCDNVSVFTRNPRGGSAKPLDQEDIAAFLKLKEELGIGTLVAHAPYTLNGCSADEKIRDFAKRTMADDLRRMEQFPEISTISIRGAM